MKIELELSPDKMKAYVRVVSEDKNEGKGKSEYIKKDIVIEYIKKQGIVYGIKELPNVVEMGKKYLVAEGKYPVPGRDGTIELLHNVNKEIKPKVLDDGRVDYRELDVAVIVKKGETIAQYIPPTIGFPGINVKGETIPSKPGRENNLFLGLNVELSPSDKNIVIAKTDGQLVEEDGKISVFPLYEVKGDLDFSVGNINFPGSVIVRRSVKPGFRIEAKGKVEVYESAEECDIITEGNIIIRKSYIGKGKSYIKAKGNIVVGFLDSAKAFAGKDVISGSAIMHSEVSAGRSVVVEGKGIIVGGKITAHKSIKAKMVGSRFGTTTILEIKKPLDIEKSIKELKDKIESDELLMKQLDTKIRALGPGLNIEKLKLLVLKNQLKLPPNQRILVNRLITTYDTLVKHVKEVKREVKRLTDLLDEFKNATVTINGTIFPGVVILFGELSYKVRDMLRFAKFYLEGGEIKVSKT